MLNSSSTAPLLAGQTPRDALLAAACVRASAIAGWLVSALGCGVLLGWLLDIAALKSVHPALVTMKANTALLFAILGAAIVAATDPRARPVRSLLALTVLAAAALTASQYAFPIDLGIDQLLFRDDRAAVGTPRPGRMALETAICFVLLGLSLLTIDSHALVRVSRFATLLVAIVSGVALVGYVYDVPLLYALSVHSPMALLTALAFLLSCGGILFARPSTGIMVVIAADSTAGALLRRLLPSTLVSIPAFGLLRVIGQRAGFYDATFGSAMFAIANVAFLSTAALVIGSSLHRADLLRRKVEATFRGLLESALDPIVITNRSGVITLINAQAERLFGYERHELIGKPVETLVPVRAQSAHPGHRNAFSAAPTARPMGSLCNLFGLRKDGSEFPAEISLAPLETDSGLLISSTVRDITARTLVERDQAFMQALGTALPTFAALDEALLHVCEQLGRHLAVSHAHFVDVHDDQDRATIRPGYGADLALAKTEVALSEWATGQTRADSRRGQSSVVHDTGQDAATQVLDATYQRVGVRAFIFVPLLREAAWVSGLEVSSAEPRRWTEREVTLVRSVAERAWMWAEHLRVLRTLREREAAEALRRSEEVFRLLVEGVKEYAIIKLDIQGRIATWNAGAARLKGYTAEEAIGQHFSIFYTEEDRRRGHPEEERRRAELDGEYTEEGWRVRKDGSTFWASVFLTLLRDDTGKPTGFAKITRDFTENRRAQAELTHGNELLRTSLKEREVLLQEVHHRVKNNLQLISSLINMQAGQLTDPVSRSALDECQLRVQAIALIHDTLYKVRDFSRIPFSEYARELATNVLQATGSTNGLELSLEPLALPVDKAIPCGLILNELITNSVKHAYPRGRTGVISVSFSKVSARDAALSVADDGVGLPASFSLDDSSSLGLKLVCALTEQLEGRLEISRPGGAAFHITFPLTP